MKKGSLPPLRVLPPVEGELVALSANNVDILVTLVILEIVDILLALTAILNYRLFFL